jgi:hypothetical protein
MDYSGVMKDKINSAILPEYTRLAFAAWSTRSFLVAAGDVIKLARPQAPGRERADAPLTRAR